MHSMRDRPFAFVIFAFFVCMVAAICPAQPKFDPASPRIEYLAPSPWRPPFGLDRPGAPSNVRITVPEPIEKAAYILETSSGSEAAIVMTYTAEQLSKSPIDVPLSAYVDKARLTVVKDGARVPISEIKIDRPDLEAAADASPENVINPVDLGTVLPPKGWLVLAPKMGTRVRVAASWKGDGTVKLTARAWFDHAPEVSGAGTLETSRADRERIRPIRPFNHTDAPAPWETHFAVPAPPMTHDRSVLHVVLEDENRVRKWTQDIPVMLIASPLQLPAFGATRLKLRYDPPISVLDLKTNALSTIPYEDGWDASLDDVVVSLPAGGRFVFWRGSSYVPFWASAMGTGLSYEWAESGPLPGGFVDSVEPLMDKELRYGRVDVVESTPARVHVRWTYQSTDFNYKVWGDAAQEDFYFYPDGYGTRVLTLKSAPDSDYELSEFIVLAPQDAYPLEFLPANTSIATLDLAGRRNDIVFPKSKSSVAGGAVEPPLLYRAPLHRADENTAIYFNPRDVFESAELVQFEPFSADGELVTPAYWGSHWPLSRGKSTGGAIDDRIRIAPSHNSLLSWAMHRPKPISEQRGEMIDALGAARQMQVQQWAWLIGYTSAPDDEVLDLARSFAHPPSIEDVKGARLNVESYAETRRAVCMTVEKPEIEFQLTPRDVCVNPVFELANAPRELAQVSLGALAPGANDVAWDGSTLWIRATIQRPTQIRVKFAMK